MEEIQRGLGYVPSPKDRRDYPASAFLPREAEPFPGHYQLPFEAPREDQGTTSMCVDYSLVTMKRLQERVERGEDPPFGHGYIYGRREADDYQGEGMIPREALDILVKHGVPPASVFDFKGTVHQCKAAVSARLGELDTAAKAQRVLSYVRCWNDEQVKGALFHLKSPVMIGILATKWFCLLTPASGIVMDEPSEHFLETSPYYAGGHAMTIVGWTQFDGRPYWIVHNSWGPYWGDRGYCYIPFDWGGIYELWAVTDAKAQGPTIRFHIDSLQAEMVKGDQVDLFTMDQPATILNGRTVVPVRAFANAMAKLLGRPIIVRPVIDAYGNVIDVEIVAPEV